MNTFTERFLLPLFVIMSSLYACYSCASTPISLTKVFHHKAVKSTYLETANIVFYFSGESHVSVGKKDQTFFFPGVTAVSQECEKMIQKINAENNGYQVKYVLKPNAGLHITFVLDKAKYKLLCQSYSSINLQKGVVFRMYNKDVLRTLEERTFEPILKMASLKKPSIMIDPGHGGEDRGTDGIGVLCEKQVCLSVGREVAQLLENYGYRAFLTRCADVDMSLDSRTTYAHEKGADIFVSIHANYAQKQSVVGIETFCSSPQLFTNNYSQLSDADQLSVSKYMHARANNAYLLASSIQKQLCSAVAPYHIVPVNRQVKRATSQVLFGAQMPSILVEIGFLSNPHEAYLLSCVEYQKIVARAICDGIISFFSC